PVVWIFATFPGPFGFVSGAVLGILSAASSPLLLVMAQQLMAGRAGVASGLLLGLGFIAGAFGLPMFGVIADLSSTRGAVLSLIPILVLSLVVAWFLPTEEHMDRIMSERKRAEDAALAESTPASSTSD